MSPELKNDCLVLWDDDVRRFKCLFDNYYLPLCYYAMKKINEKESAEEIVSDAFIKFWDRREKFESQKQVKAFLYKTVYHDCINFVIAANRSKKYIKEIAQILKKNEAGNDADEIQAEVYEMIYQEIENDTGIQGKIIKLLLKSVKPKEIARQLNIKVSSVYVAKSRFVSQIRNKLKK